MAQKIVEALRADADFWNLKRGTITWEGPGGRDEDYSVAFTPTKALCMSCTELLHAPFGAVIPLHLSYAHFARSARTCSLCDLIHSDWLKATEAWDEAVGKSDLGPELRLDGHRHTQQIQRLSCNQESFLEVLFIRSNLPSDFYARQLRSEYEKWAWEAVPRRYGGAGFRCPYDEPDSGTRYDCKQAIEWFLDFSDETDEKFTRFSENWLPKQWHVESLPESFSRYHRAALSPVPPSRDPIR
ncbi:hypothetical protein F5Y15DRAFT_119219 [Xylariaceae sp. FL0016]|nr:hypothetical protein F5Y15DRAFT_119219 [Xylariaceae sp. FL0016]